MKKPLLFLMLALPSAMALLPITALVQAAEKDAQRVGRAAIAAIYRRNDAAMVSKNWNDLTSYLAPDYQMIMRNGQKLNRAQSIAMMRQIIGGSGAGPILKYSKCTTRIQSVTWRGKDAVVIAQATAVGTAQANAQDGQKARMEQVSATRDYWTPTAAGWKLRQSVETESKVWFNGQRFQ